MFRLLNKRAYTTALAKSTAGEGWLYVDSVFPVRLGRWDPRYYVGTLREEHLLSVLQDRLEHLSNIYNFKPLELDPQRKDGGVFVRFSCVLPSSEPAADGLDSYSILQQALNDEVKKLGGLPTWHGIGSGGLWIVKGSPWKEDMNRFASPILKIAFDGPDVQEQDLYELCRPYGRIRDLSSPSPVPAGNLRFSTITFQNLHSATIARNVLHGLQLPSPNSSSPTTRLRTHYEKPLEVHVIRDWMSSHPKIMLPLLVFLLGTLTYTIFDPIRSLMVEAKMLNWFDYRKTKLYQWLQDNAFARFAHTIDTNAHPLDGSDSQEVWKERQAAQGALQAYLSDTPTTIAFVHGPQGSGKTRMLQSVIRDSGRNALVIDCRELMNSSTDSTLIAELATQTGYWPVFTFLNSMNSLIDMASVGLIGQKVGVSSSLPDQLKQILEVVTQGLRRVSSSHLGHLQKKMKQAKEVKSRQVQVLQHQQAIIQGTWHDPRLDCIAGNGIISELGVGDELFEGEMSDRLEKFLDLHKQEKEEEDALERKQKALADVDAVKSLPVIIIRNYGANLGSSAKEDLLIVLARWAAKLVESHIAHVVILSDNRENSKRLTKALALKPLNYIALSDADAASSLSLVQQKLHDSGSDFHISSQDARYIERLGGRASDLESLIHKVRHGMKVEEAVEDIISRGVVELRKNVFGDDGDDGKGLPWSRYQAWKIVKMLATKPEVSYYEMLVDFPFKGDEHALRNMEHADIISVATKDGRPTSVRPGKPVLRYVFERLVNDKYFKAVQELAYNEKQISDTEVKIGQYEQELALLVDTMKKEQRPWYSIGRSSCHNRARSIGEKLALAERKVTALERKNVEYRRLLAKEI